MKAALQFRGLDADSGSSRRSHQRVKLKGWMADPSAQETEPNPFGGINSVLKVGQWA